MLNNPVNMTTEKWEVAVSQIFDLFEKWGQENYIGEQVSQLQHAQQVGFLETETALAPLPEWMSSEIFSPFRQQCWHNKMDPVKKS